MTIRQDYRRKLEETYYGRWVKNYRVSYLVILILVLYGTYSLVVIPKESSPNIKFGIVQITTIYPGANPVDIDATITEKVYKEIKDIPGIDGVSATSSQGVSAVMVTLENGIDVKDFINDARTKVDSIPFPDDVKKPVLSEIGTDNEVLFQLVMYGSKNEFTMNGLRSLAMQLRRDINGKGSIVDVSIAGVQDDNDFDVEVALDAKKLEQYGLTVLDVTNQIRQYNQNLPLGSHSIGDLTYDYRISNDIQTWEQLKSIPILLSAGKGNILLSDIALIQRKFINTTVSYGGEKDIIGQYGVPITIYKKEGGNIFADAKAAKDTIEKTLSRLEYKKVAVQYTKDLSDVIIDDYISLGRNAITSILLVLIVTSFFIGFKQSLIATLGMILSFFITFIILKMMGASMNFLTNFSLILAFGAGIDTVLVFIEAAYENMKKGFNPKTAILIAVKTYKSANINTSLINIVVFIPMLVLPGITGKFLSYIPITIFTTLLGSLFLALTINSALFVAFNKKLSYYFADTTSDEEVVMSDEELAILQSEQVGKTPRSKSQEPFFEKRFDAIRSKYLAVLKATIGNTFYRRISIWAPIIALVATFVFLSPRIGFKLFPSGDNPFIDYEIVAQEGTTTEAMTRAVQGVDVIIAKIPELKSYEITIAKNVVTVGVNLVKKEERKRDSFQVEEQISKDLAYLRTQGYRVSGKVQAGGPPVGKAVGLELVTDDKNKLPQLKAVSKDFENFIKSLTGTTNVSNSSKENPGQFSVRFDDQKLSAQGLSPQDIKGELYAMLQGTKAGSMSLESIDRDIIVRLAGLDEGFSPDQLDSLVLQTRAGPLALNSVASITVGQSLTSIQRKDGEISIQVEADLEKGLAPTAVQPKLVAYADSYDFPDGVAYKQAGENEANKDLIQATMIAFVIALMMAFGILVYQFNSFSKPAMVLYSVITALLGVNIGLRITGSPYSMAFGIGFISLIGVVINTAIFLVDRINYNLEHGADIERAIQEAGYVRFKPILISTITTILGLGSVVTQDEFYATLGYTVIFGLLFSAAITLIAVPNLYYSLFKRKEKRAAQALAAA